MTNLMTNLCECVRPQPNDTCLLCGGKPGFIGIFVPEHPEVWGGKERKTRLIRYCLCLECKQRDNQECIEKVLFARLKGGTEHAA